MSKSQTHPSHYKIYLADVTSQELHLLHTRCSPSLGDSPPTQTLQSGEKIWINAI